MERENVAATAWAAATYRSVTSGFARLEICRLHWPVVWHYCWAKIRWAKQTEIGLNQRLPPHTNLSEISRLQRNWSRVTPNSIALASYPVHLKRLQFTSFACGFGTQPRQKETYQTKYNWTIKGVLMAPKLDFSENTFQVAKSTHTH